jgi:hypothetical protein
MATMTELFTDEERCEYWRGAYDRMSARSIEDGARIAALETEVAKMRAALVPFADVADLMDSEAEGFVMEDTLQLCVMNEGFQTYHVNSFCLQRFYTARAALETKS